MADWTTPGYEDLELSTQRIIHAALERDIEVEILDRENQWIRLRKNDHVEIIRQGNETRADSYITSLILGDKFIQKKLLEEASISVPKGDKYTELEAALNDFQRYQSDQWVVKPTTTNYGIGITILEKNTSEVDFKKAVKEAFLHDKSIIIEQFISGIECRFLVIGGKCRAVLHRVPANVLGDGKSSITELVEQKNEDPRRGENYKTPLEKIQIGPAEIAVLKEQNLSPESIVPANQTAWLRKNSNISTGGDSLDYTDEIHPSYAEIAEAACTTVSAQICGVDLLLSDYKETAQADNHAIIELNYNPVLYFHDFPFRGENRNVAPHVLDLLGF